ncbi:MAG TPA: hypothetical protein VNZ57_08070, partial [Longimicrobiales bacterium]|nr:hypothetical protein [Longimicrobiales bacterium]
MDPEDSVRALEATPGVRHARQVIREFDALTLDEMCEIAAVPAPPFGERERARLIADRMRNTGLERVRIDRVGNVLARYPLSGGPLSGSEQAACHIGPAAGDVGEGPVLVAAHLDTVFPPDTRIDVRRDDGRIRAPG